MNFNVINQEYSEVNFDGLVGPTHHYGGHSNGNLASLKNAAKVSNPQAAALQSLAKMRFLSEFGFIQAVLPPHERPCEATLRILGYRGSLKKMINSVASNQTLLSNIMSASSMWAANAATVSPSLDTQDNRLHITPANLSSTFHRALESKQNHRILKKIFNHKQHFKVHKPLPLLKGLGDEGAANHNRLCSKHNDKGLELFVYGHRVFEANKHKFPRRQSLEASEAIARKHLLNSKNTFFIQQSAKAIDVGAFHNDVVCVINENTILAHEYSFENQRNNIKNLLNQCDFITHYLEIKNDEVPLEDAINSYLFNSQLLTTASGSMILLLPKEAESNRTVLQCVERILYSDNPIKKAYYVDLKQSMKNGGGPACLRLRVLMNDEQITALNGQIIINDETIGRLENIVKRYYRTELYPQDLSDPELIDDSLRALDEYTQCLKLGAIYDFQR